MNKILNYIFVFFLFILFSCSYEPILNKKNYQFSINLINASGDKLINSIIVNRFDNLNGNKKKYDLTFTSKKEKNIISKDSKGDPTMFELLVVVNYNVKIDGKIILERNIKRNNTYNNISDKFELEKYEKSIIINLSNNISNDIVSSISQIE